MSLIIIIIIIIIPEIRKTGSDFASGSMTVTDRPTQYTCRYRGRPIEWNQQIKSSMFSYTGCTNQGCLTWL